MASTLVDNRRVRLRNCTGLKRSTLNNYWDSSRRAPNSSARQPAAGGGLVSSFKQVAVDQTSEQRRRFEVAEVVNEIMAMPIRSCALPIEILRDIPPGWCLTVIPVPLTGDRHPRQQRDPARLYRRA